MNQDAECNSLNELAALRQRLEELEAEHRDLQRQVSRRPFFSRKFVLSALAGTLVMVTVAILWGQEVKSIFVDPNGNVGIGTNQPGAKLDVSGGATFSSVGINHAPLSGQTLLVVPKNGDIPFNVTDPANAVNWLAVDKAGEVRMNGASVNIGMGVAADTGTPLNVKGAATFTGVVDVKGTIKGNGLVTVGDQLFVQGERGGTASITKNAFVGTDNKWQIKDTTKKAFTMEIRDSGVLDLYGTKTNGGTDWLRVAGFDGANNKVEFGELINNAPSNTDVIINGGLTTTGTINGEKLPLSFRINATGTGNWNTVVQDIGSLCGDEDGCRIKLLLHHSIDGSVKTLTEEVYIGNPDRTKLNGGLGGYTRQSGGGEYKDWRLDTNDRYDLFNPWEWCKASNYIPNGYNVVSLPPGTPADREKAFRGANKYKIAFSCHPHIMGTFIIYDR